MVGVDLGLGLTAILLFVPTALPAGRSRKAPDEASSTQPDEPPQQDEGLGSAKAEALAAAIALLGLNGSKTPKPSPKQQPYLLIHNGLSSRLPRRSRD